MLAKKPRATAPNIKRPTNFNKTKVYFPPI